MRTILLLCVCFGLCASISWGSKKVTAYYQQASQSSLNQLEHLAENFCVNDHEDCEEFVKEEGECERNANFMHTNCRAACGVCDDLSRSQIDGYVDVLLYGLRNTLSGLMHHVANDVAIAVRKELGRAVWTSKQAAEGHAVKNMADILTKAVTVIRAAVPYVATEVSIPPPPRGVNVIITSTVPLPNANNLQIPRVGFGTWNLEGQEGEDAIVEALKIGYRHIDTAQGYYNEEIVGNAIKKSGVPRGAIFLATKLSFEDDCTGARIRSVVMSQLTKLQTDYIDLYMFHSPHGTKENRVETWRELEKMVLTLITRIALTTLTLTHAV